MAKVYANIIDNILDEPDLSPNEMGEESNRGDVLLDLTQKDADEDFLDDIAGHSDHTGLPGGSSIRANQADWRGRSAHALETGILAEAVSSLHVANPAPFRFRSLRHAAVAGQVMARQIKTSSREATKLRDAAALLKRVVEKTAAQRRADGARSLDDYANPNVVPGWAGQVRASIKVIASVFGKYLPVAPAEVKQKFASYIPDATAPSAETGDGIFDERKLSDAQAVAWVHKLLNSGEAPKSIERKIEKMAELQAVTHSVATDYLKDNSGMLGFAYIEPAAYMGSCEKSHSRMAKAGGVKAHSVKRIAACTGCAQYKKASGPNGPRCGIYRLPIVSKAAELLPIINNLVPGATNKKAALTALANGEARRASLDVKEVHLNRNKASDHKLGGKLAKAEEAEKTFTASDALALHRAGAKLTDTYKQAVQKVGSVQANQAIRQFIAGLKKNRVALDLTQIDCKPLKGKLATPNAIVGAQKCGSCTYRSGMHCGLTGGTLVHFEGMEKVNRKSAAVPQDGTKTLKDFDMLRTASSGDIDISGPGFADVNLDRSEINL